MTEFQALMNNFSSIPSSFSDPNIQKIFQNVYTSTYPFAYCIQLTAAFFYVTLQTGYLLRYIKNLKSKDNLNNVDNDTNSKSKKNDESSLPMTNVKFY